MKRRAVLFLALLSIIAPSHLSAAEDSRLYADHPVTIDGLEFDSWAQYIVSDYFQRMGKRCGTPNRAESIRIAEERGYLVDNDSVRKGLERLKAVAPTDVLEITVVVHIITAEDGTTGDLTDLVVQSQIDILNEDFLAQAGTNGAGGVNSNIRFVLADQDPGGLTSTGITRTANDDWFADNNEQAFKTGLLWDTNNYLNIYTNNTDSLGYAYSPQAAQARGGMASSSITCPLVETRHPHRMIRAGPPPMRLATTSGSTTCSIRRDLARPGRRIATRMTATSYVTPFPRSTQTVVAPPVR